MQGNPSVRRSAVGSGLLTGLSTAAVSGSAAVAGAILSRKFGHGVKTDGFFAAYSVYIAVVLVANALRVVVTGLLMQMVSGQAAARFSHDAAGWGMIVVAALLFGLLVAYLRRLVILVEYQTGPYFLRRSTSDKPAS